jgi:Arc/MetJ-type ribon-helix-helix transcriptional regulator
MVQAQFSLDESSWAFVQRSEHYGFQSRDELVRLALGKLQQELTQLESSAELYAEEYTADGDLRALTDSAIVGWVE